MKLIQSLKNKARALVQSYGTSEMRRSLWNKEFTRGHWDFTDDTSDDFVYRYIAKYSRGGAILDLGCGSGNTACELPSGAYHHYTGVDVSDVAVEKARKRAEREGRGEDTEYRQGDITTYEPDQAYDVFLFRESLPYVPKSRVKGVLERYARWLSPSGVFIFSWCDRVQLEALLVDSISVFPMVEEHFVASRGSYLAVMQPKSGKR